MSPVPEDGSPSLLEALRLDRLRQDWRHVLTILLVYVLGLSLLSPLLPGVLLNLPDMDRLEAGSVSDRRVVADRDYTFVDLDNTEKRREARLKLVRPVYRIQEDLTFQAVAQYDEAAAVIRKFLEDRSKRDIVALELEALLPRVQVQLILDELAQANVSPASLQRQREQFLVALEKGVINDSSQDIPAQGIEVRLRRGSGDVRQFYPRDQVQTLSQVRRSLGPLAAQLVVSNAVFDRQATEDAERQVLSATPPVLLSFQKGEIILENEEVLSPEKVQRLRALQLSLRQEFWSKGFVIAVSLLILLLLGLKTLQVGLEGHYDRVNLLYFAVVTWIINLGFHVLFTVLNFPLLRVIFSPVGLFVMIAVLLSNRLTGVLLSLLLTVPLLMFLPDGHWGELGIPAALCAFLFHRAEKRFGVLASGLLYGMVLGAHLLVSQIWVGGWTTGALLLAGQGVLNGLISALLALGLLPALENLFNFTTRFRLQELSDLNSPILKKMFSLAPGTYAHSINVSHLAETAARAVGADPLLARVGAIYHDIGKIDQAEYFVENQRGQNPHDELDPRVSAAVLKNHVVQGVERARELRLPTRVIDIIRQHHGRGLIEYFYNKALKTDKDRVVPEDFRYPGPNPQFRECGIVMIADTVEAASRTLQNPDYHYLEELIDTLVDRKTTEGLLTESGLTLKDLHVIKDVLLHTLAGQFHSRIEYGSLAHAN